MLRKKWLVFVSLFVAGAAAGAAIALPFCPATLTGEAQTLARIGEVFVILLAVAIPLSYLILMAVGALQVTRPPQVPIDASQEMRVHTPHQIHRVLVTAGGGDNARYGLELAGRIAEDDCGEISLMRVLAPDQAGRRDDLEAELTSIAAEALGSHYPVSVLIPVRDSVVDAVLDEARQGYDLLVIGASEHRPLRNWLFGALPDLIVRQAPCPVLVVRAGDTDS